jgi:hypothetical protein
MRRVLAVTLIAAIIGLASCSQFPATESAFTLYRNSLLGNPSLNRSSRIHIATFDADDGRDYNQGNCETARQLFQSQDGVKTRFWCEMGRYRK